MKVIIWHFRLKKLLTQKSSLDLKPFRDATKATMDRKKILSLNAILLGILRLYRCTMKKCWSNLERIHIEALQISRRADKSIYTRIISSESRHILPFLKIILHWWKLWWNGIRSKQNRNIVWNWSYFDFVEQNFKKQNGQYAFSANLDPSWWRFLQLEDSSLPNPQVSLKMPFGLCIISQGSKMVGIYWSDIGLWFAESVCFAIFYKQHIWCR